MYALHTYIFRSASCRPNKITCYFPKYISYKSKVYAGLQVASSGRNSTTRCCVLRSSVFVYFCTLWWFDDAVHWRWKVHNLTTKLDWKYSMQADTEKWSGLFHLPFLYHSILYTPFWYIPLKGIRKFVYSLLGNWYI